MNAITKAAAALLAMSVQSACADGDLYSGYVRLGRADTDRSSSWNAAGGWSDGMAPSGSKDYHVPSDALLWRNHNADAANRTWQGGRLALEGIFHSVVNQTEAYAPMIRDLVMLGGSEVRSMGFGPFGVVNGETGTVTVAATEVNPATISHHHVNSSNGTRGFGLNAIFTGTPSSVLVYTRPYTNFNGDACDYGWFCLAGRNAFASYPGLLVLRGGNTKFMPLRGEAFNWPQTALRVEDGANCHLSRDATFSAGVSDAYLRTLDVVGGNVIFSHATAQGTSRLFPAVNVSERLSADGNASFTIPLNVTNLLFGVNPENAVGATYRVAHLTGAAAAASCDLSEAKVAAADNDQFGYPAKLHIVDNGDGTKDVWIATPGVVAMTNRNVESGASAYGAFEAGHAGDWTNLETPPPDSTLRYMAMQRLCFFTDTQMPDARLSLASYSSWLDGEQIAFREVDLCKGGSFGAWGASSKDRKLKADRLNVLSTNGNELFVSAGVSLTVDAEVRGGGALTLRNNNDGYGSISLPGLNTNFHGRIIVRQGAASDGTLTPNRLNIYMYDARNLGGRYTASEDGWNAITVRDAPVLVARSDMDFAEPTRGILFRGAPTVSVVGGATVRFASQTTFDGAVKKAGVGTLDLAGTVRFGDGREGTAPVAAANALAVAGGTLRISSKTAADGLAISFAEGTRLRIPSDSEGGYFNVRWDTPLSVETQDGRLPVEVEPAVSVSGDRNVTVTICTFSATAAEGIPVETFAVKMLKQGMVTKSLRKHVNADSTVSYLATFGPVGCRIVIR